MDVQDKFLYACRIIEKAYIRHHRVFVYADNKADAEAMDELLWTFKEDSFIPHNLQGEGPEPPPPIQIGFNDEPRGFDDVLVNLSSNSPRFYHRFKRIIEIVIDHEADKTASRSRYRFYKNQQCVIKTHQIES